MPPELEEKPTLGESEGASIQDVQPSNDAENNDASATADVKGSIFDVDEENLTDGDQSGDQQKGNTDDDTQKSDTKSKDSDEGDAADDDSGQQITTEDLASYFGVDPDVFDINDDGQVTVKTNVNGKVSTVTLKDAISSYQLQGNLNDKTRQANELTEKLTAQLNESRQAHLTKLQTLEDLTILAFKELQDDLKKEEWADLEREDPGLFAAKRQKLLEKQHSIANRLRAIQQERDRMHKQSDAAVEAKETELLIEKIPAWADESVKKSDSDRIADYATRPEVGLTVEDLTKLNKSGFAVVFMDALKYHELQSNKANVKKLVKKTPKLSRSGTKPAGGGEKDIPIEDIFYGTG